MREGLISYKGDFLVEFLERVFITVCLSTRGVLGVNVRVILLHHLPALGERKLHRSLAQSRVANSKSVVAPVEVNARSS